MKKRQVVAEILDELDAGDPRAIRSRRDLKWINRLMGNERWILKAAANFPEVAKKGISEVGAGDGRLSEQLAVQFPGVEVTGYDLAPRPEGLREDVRWVQGNLFASEAPRSGGILVANLFLHHFDKEALGRMGEWMDDFDVWVINEPDRAVFPHFLGWMMHPWVNDVTRHDMHVSIDAGFGEGELVRDLGVEEGKWRKEESSTWRGGRRVLVWRV